MHMQSVSNVLIMSVTYFSLSVIPWDFSTFFEKVRWNNFGKGGEWTRKIDTRQNYGNLPGSWRSMHSYTLTYSRLWSEKISLFWVLNIGDLNFCTPSMPLKANKQNHSDKELAKRDNRRKKLQKFKTFLKRKDPQKLLTNSNTNNSSWAEGTRKIPEWNIQATKKKHYKEQTIIMKILVHLTFQESPLCLYYHDNHTGYTTETITSWLQTKTLPVIMIDSFQTNVTDVRCWKWFTETSQIITVTGQTHSRSYHYYIYIYYTVLQQS